MLISQRPVLTEEPISEFRSRFVLEPLEPGFGYTLGNWLRRTLLSSIPGAAVTSIRIDGVLHEFTTVPGMKEDVTELILNIKQLVITRAGRAGGHVPAGKQGPGTVTAADIQPPAGVEVHNPDLHIATLNARGKLSMERPSIVERGRGYVAGRAEQAGRPGDRAHPGRRHLLPGAQGHLQGRGDPCRAADGLRPLGRGRRDQASIRARDAVASAGKTLVELFGLARDLNARRRGHRARTVPRSTPTWPSSSASRSRP